jgi:hypothetical protein
MAKQRRGSNNAFSIALARPEAGRNFDEVEPVIEELWWLTGGDGHSIFEANCQKVYTRAFTESASP